MAVRFYDVLCYVNTTGILAESASIEVSNSLAPAYSLGARGSCDQSPSGPLKTTLTLDYYLQTNKEPNYITASGLRSYVSESPVTVGIAGLGAVAYLERYSIRADPNSLIKASASYTCFTPLGGELRTKLISLNYTGSNPSGIAHSWATEPQSNSQILGFSYELTAKWEPVYGIGNANPVNVLFHGGQETFTFARDTFTKPTFSGVDASTYLTDGTSFNVNSLNVFCGHQGNNINIDCSNAKVVSSSIGAAIKDIVRTNTVLTRYF